MINIIKLLDSQTATNMGYSLVHSLWQGAIVTAVLLFMLKSIGGNRNELRYKLSVISLLGIVVCWLGTFSVLRYKSTATAERVEQAKLTSIEISSASNSNDIVQEIQKQVRKTELAEQGFSAENINSSKVSEIGTAGWGVILWTIGVCMMTIRIFRSLAGAAKIRKNAVDIDDRVIVELFERLCRQMKCGRNTRLAASSILHSPGVVGFWQPIVLVPVSILSEISVDDLEAILAHELAHIRRFDYMVNFCQMVVEAVLFFNPAVWLISRQIRIEREACCDAAGVATVGERIQYAKVLLEQFARSASVKRAGSVAAMTGFSDSNKGTNEERISRIVHPHYKPRMKIGWVKLVCWVIISAAVLAGLSKTADVAVAVAAQIMTP